MSPEDAGRLGRAEEVRRERRRRGDENLSVSAKLPIPPEVQAWADREGMHLRWVNDEGDRIVRLTKYDDYDTVDGVKPVPVVVDRKNGVTVEAHLLAKPRAFIEEDRRKSDQRRRETEETLVRTPDAASGPGANPHPATAQTYVAKGSSISRGNQILE